ncbi:MATE efflux family protein [Stanieria sp. NIES-3757]|nr:MATE efflux family protein [Stanieria sp. NIES-3757]
MIFAKIGLLTKSEVCVMKSNPSQAIEQTLTTGSVRSHLIQLSVPMFWGLLTVVALSLTDTYFVAQLGTKELAAMSFIFPIFSTFACLAMGLGNGAGAVIARAIGEGDRDKMKRLITDTLALSVLISVCFTLAGLITIKPLFTALGAEAEILPAIADYMEIWYLGTISLVVPIIANSIIRAAGNSQFPALVMTVATVVNIVLDPLLIFGWAGFPRLEVQGAALATVISQIIGLIAVFWFLYYREKVIIFNPPKIQEVAESWQEVLHIGIPAAVTNAISPIAIAIITSMIAAYGAEAVAGFGIASRIESLVFIAFIALSASVTPLVGQNWGAGKLKRVNQSFYWSAIFCLIWGGLAALILGLSSSHLASVFNQNPEVISIATTYLIIVPVSYAAAGVVQMSGSTFNALGKPLPSVVMNLVQMFVLYLPLAYAGSRLLGVNEIFIGISLSNLAIGLGAYCWNQKALKNLAHQFVQSTNQLFNYYIDMNQLTFLQHRPAYRPQTVSWRVRGLRGATTVTENSSRAIAEAVRELFDVLERKNQLDPELIVSVVFSVTKDLNAIFPASVVRHRPGWDLVPLLDVQQMDVPDSLPRCIRVLIQFNTPLPQTALQPVYLRDAALLRPDLAIAH